MQAQVAEERVQIKPVTQQKFMFTSIGATMEHHFIVHLPFGEPGNGL